jgi:YD repeat-containing protein
MLQPRKSYLSYRFSCTPLAATLIIATVGLPAPAQSIYVEQGKLIRAPQAVGALGTDLFGDSVNYYSGSLEFIQNDINLPGNNALPVSIGRHLSTGSFSMGGGLFGKWDLEIPHLHGIFPAQLGWITGSAIGPGSARCSQFGPPPMVSSSYGGSGLWSGVEYWHGSFLYVPGAGDQEILRRTAANPHVPLDGAAESFPYTTYPLVTRNLWAIKCVPSLAQGGQGEGFLAIAPDGTQYQFDWMVSRAATNLEKGTTAPEYAMRAAATSQTAAGLPIPTPDAVDGEVIARKEVWILPSKVTDRFGNTVSYTYSLTNPWQLQTIIASDDRKISLSYIPSTNLVSSISDGTRTWTYSYNAAGALSTLDTVTLPDASKWQLLGADALMEDLMYDASPRCNYAGLLSAAIRNGRLVHPSGAIGDFTLTTTAHGRSNVPLSCRNAGTSGEYPYHPRDFATNALTKKTISGPGLATLQWSAAYPPAESSWAPCVGCAASKVVEVTNPGGDKIRYTFGTSFRTTEGQLQQSDIVDADGSVIRSAHTSYRDPATGPFPDPMGISDQGRGDGEMASRLHVVEQRTTTQQGVDFKWTVNGVNGIDTKGRPVDITRSSSLGPTRTERTAYADNTRKWVLSQIASVTEASTGSIMVSNGYDKFTAALTSVSHFGKLDQSMSYSADGTLKTRADGAGHTTSFSNYMRGLPQIVLYPDGGAESAVVSNIGTITSVTDALNFRTTYAYDAMGRLGRITHPAGTLPDPVVWSDTVLDFAPVANYEFGLDAGHWRQTVTTGNAITVNYMDALFRPLLTRTYDAANEATTSRMIVRAYDDRGKATFESYPQRSISLVTERPAGIATEYDALGRMVHTLADSELGTLTTSADYLSGFQKRVTNPRGFASVTSYQAFDEPLESAPTAISASESLAVAIARDIFGKARAITRSGGGASATRNYVYDTNERLCKTVEPETGATMLDYDAANNIAWRASGLVLTALTCDRISVVGAAPKTTFGYDAMNRLTSTVYGDGSAAVTRTYTADGLPLTVTSDGATWTMGYNSRRLPSSEVLSFGGSTYTFGRIYDINGNPNQLNYPTAAQGNPIGIKSIAYTPNALGEPSQVGTFASGISYHPNGAIAAFSYGNGKTHSLMQNLRGLPDLSNDTGVILDKYDYDENGNVISIADRLPVNSSTRTLGYDGLDRLHTAAAPGMWGGATYNYNVLDNITSSTIGTRVSTYNYDVKNRLGSLASTVASYGFAYAYDAQGNVIGRDSQTYSFDQANRMTAAKGRATYRYDGFGRRLKATAADGTVTTTIYSPAGQLLYATQRGGPRPPVTTEYIYLHNHQIAEVKR